MGDSGKVISYIEKLLWGKVGQKLQLVSSDVVMLRDEHVTTG